MRCMKCGKDFEEKDIHKHHIIPKFCHKFLKDKIGNYIEGGKTNFQKYKQHSELEKRTPLCEKNHTELHDYILEIIRQYSYRKRGKSVHWLWLYVPYFKKKKCIDEIINFTKRWMKKNDTKTAAES